jgi:autotransporter-associated beta strand protein
VGDGTTDGSLAGNVAVESGGTLVFDVAAVDQYMGQISGEGGLVKEGDGVLTLDGANSCAGTTVLGGILAAVDPVDITYGTALADGQLSGSVIWAVDGSPVSVAGTFSYGSAAGTVLGAGGGQAEAVTFTPTDTADYTAVSTTAAVSVGQATPTITWAAPPAIAYGTALGDTQLDAASSWTVGGAPGSVDGTFTYTPAAGQVLAAGSQTLSVTFTPADAVDYSPATATVSITVNPPPASVVGEYVFYNESIWGTTVAPDKSALLPGEAASFANYTSYDEGLNGIAVDIANLPGTSLSAGDFQFSVGNGSVTDGSTWALASAAPTVTVVPGGGTGGSSRVLLVWADNAIQDTWLRVEVLADADTGLAAPFVFYFGNQIGSTGTAPNAKVTAIDLSAVVNNAQPSGASITNPYDFNRDGKVTAIDVSIVVNNAAAGTAIKFFTPTDT